MGWGTWDHGEWSALQRQVLDDQAKEAGTQKSRSSSDPKVVWKSNMHVTGTKAHHRSSYQINDTHNAE